MLLVIHLAVISLTFSSFPAASNDSHVNVSPQNHVKKITLGMSTPLTGPTENLGIELRKGANSYFSQLNKSGGIDGQHVELISLDDGYEPQNTVINTKHFISQQVLALFGYVGTPTSHAIIPILNNSQIPYLMPFTGADFLREPIHNNLINLRASYYQELQAQVDYLAKIAINKNIALVIQADEFGLAVQRSINQIFIDKKLPIALTARYKRNSINIAEVVTKLSGQPIDIVIFVGTYQPFIRLINLAYQQQLDILFTTLSFIGSHNVLNKIPARSKVLISEVMPDPKSCQWQLCQQFKVDMNSAGYTELNRVQLEGYMNAFVFSQVAKQCKKRLTQQCLLKEFKHYNYQDNELNISFSPSTPQGMQQVYFSLSDALKAGSLAPVITH